MATWVTHLMIADGILDRIDGIDRHGFCVGNIAPDCNIENEDWTSFTPSREITHWMQGPRKSGSDADRFCEEYILRRKSELKTEEEYAFLLGYYAHLMTDASFQAMIRDEDRMRAVWNRIRGTPSLGMLSETMAPTWDSVKHLIPTKERMREIHALEAEYLRSHPNSGYLTEILPLQSCADYIDYLPKGAVVRKVGIMGRLPKNEQSIYPFVAMTREEYDEYLEAAFKLILKNLGEKL